MAERRYLGEWGTRPGPGERDEKTREEKGERERKGVYLVCLTLKARL